MIYTIGKSPENNLVLSNPAVTQFHAKITKNTTQEAILEDLNSTNGTFVNGHRVSKLIITPTDVVTIAGLNIDLSAFWTVPKNKNTTTDTGKFKEAFPKLKKAYETYQQDKKIITKNHGLKTGLIGASLTLVPAIVALLIFKDPQQKILYAGLLAAIFGAISQLILRTMTPTEKLNQVQKRFQREYVCPTCSNPISSLYDPETLERKGNCPCGKEKCF